MGYMKKYYPDEVIDRVENINLEDLKKKNITTLICDVDNTLCTHDSCNVSQNKKNWILQAQSMGMRVILISNNHVSRIEKIATSLNCATFGFALKPFPHTYRKILKTYHLSKDEVVCIGDQLMTDIWGARLMRLKNIYVKPMSESDIIYTKFSRKIEKKIIKEKL